MTMNRRVSPTLIGAFVLGAVLLAVMAVVLIGSGRYFRRTSPFVLYFPGSVNGLRVGAPVKFRGVEIGSVEDIRLQLQRGPECIRIPVIIGIDPEKITSLGGSETILNSPAEYQSAHRWRAPGAASDREFRYRGRCSWRWTISPAAPATLVQQPRHPQGSDTARFRRSRHRPRRRGWR